jgi:hypothetical protein
MAGQATIRRTNGPVEKPARVIRRNLAELAHDAVTLLELQAGLLKIDTKEAARKSITGIAAFAVSAGVLLAAAAVALAALGFVLVEQGGFSHAAGFAISAACGAVLGGLLAVLGWLRLRGSLSTISRSRDEFARNVQWFKGVLKQGVQRAPNKE